MTGCPPRPSTFSRRNVAKRDHHTCQYCGAQPGWEPITIDHVLPRSRGGASSWTNCVAACVACNARKADRTPEQAGMRLRKTPVRPLWKPLFAAREARVESWSRFLAHRARAGSGVSFRTAVPVRPGPHLTGACSWESSEPPKPVDRVRILAPLLTGTADVAERRGTCLLNRFMPVRVRPSACLMIPSPWSVTDSHATLRRSQTRFDSWRGHSPRVCRTARRPSKPRDRVRLPGGVSFGTFTTSSGCEGSHATLRRSRARFDSWRGHALRMMLEPDGQATGCNPVEVGSTPTGISPPTARSDSIFLLKR